MWHDYIAPNIPKRDSQGNICPNETIMEYAISEKKKSWSQCSFEDTEKFYNDEINEKGQFCLEDISRNFFSSNTYNYKLDTFSTDNILGKCENRTRTCETYATSATACKNDVFLFEACCEYCKRYTRDTVCDDEG